jgi:large subunit ribosomal protein L19
MGRLLFQSVDGGSSLAGLTWLPGSNMLHAALTSFSTDSLQPMQNKKDAPPPIGQNTVILTEKAPSMPVQPPNQKLVAKYRPWDITRHLITKSSYPSRMGFLIQSIEEEQVQKIQQQRKYPDFQSGDILEVRMIVPENQKRQYIYRGVCIARFNKGIRSSFKLYNVYPDGGGVVQHIPLYMPDLQDIKIIGKVPAGSRVKKYHILENTTSKYTFQKQVRAFKAGASDAEENSSS